jgi:hypothetical protein
MTAAVTVLPAAAEVAPVRAPWIRRLAGRRTLAFVLVAAADLLLWGASLGWGAALLGWTALAVLAVSGGVRPRSRGVQALYLLAAVQVGALVLHPTPLRIGVALLALAVVALADRQGFTWAVGTWLRRLFFLGPVLLVQPIEDFAYASRHLRRQGRRSLSWTSPTRWILPLALGLVFVVIFAVANPLLDRWLGEAGDQVEVWLKDLEALRMVFWAAVALCAWGFLRTRTPGPRRTRGGVAPAPRPPARPAPPPLQGVTAAWVLAPATLLRCLVVLNLVFLLQNALDASYLWLGRALPSGLTYAEYAQRGAYPLLVATLLAAAFVLLTFRAGADPQTLRGPRRLVFLFLAQNVLLTAGALRRLALYVDAYSLTRWRVAAALWMLLVALGLVLVAVRILKGRTNAWLVRRCALASLLLVVGAAWAPIDRWIADFNVARCTELAGPGHTPIDLGYLQELSTSALPALDRLSTEAPGPVLRQEARSLARAERAQVHEALGDWRAWTLHRASVAASTEPAAR